MGLSSTVFEINGDFSQKSQIFPPHVYLSPMLNRLPLELGNTGGGNKLEWWVASRERGLTICLAVWLQYINVSDRHRLTAAVPRYA